MSLTLGALLVLACASPPVAVPSPGAGTTSPATSTPPSTRGPGAATTIPAACENRYQTGDVAIVAPRKSGQHLEVALDAVRPGQNGHNRWMVRFFVPASAPGPAFIALDAAVVGPSGPLQVFGYEAGPPNAGTIPVTQPVTMAPCDSFSGGRSLGVVVLGVETSAVTSGTYTLTWRELRRPEGPRTGESWTVMLTCSVAASAPGAPPTTECR